MTARRRRPRTFRQAFGELLRERRLERGLRLVDVATPAGLTPGQVSRLEHGLRRPAAPRVAALLAVLGLELELVRRQAADRLRAPM